MPNGKPKFPRDLGRRHRHQQLKLLRTDPFEYADITSNTHYEWFLRHDYFVLYMIAVATKFLDTFQ